MDRITHEELRAHPQVAEELEPDEGLEDEDEDEELEVPHQAVDPEALA